MPTTPSAGDSRAFASWGYMLRIQDAIYKNDGTKITTGTASSLVSTDQGTFGTGAVPVQIATTSGMWYVDLTAAQCTGSNVSVFITTDAASATATRFVIPIIRRKALLTGTARTTGSPTTSQIQLATTAPATDGALYNMDIGINGGTGAGQMRRCIGYTGATRMADLDAALGTASSTDSTYEVLPAAEASAVCGWQGSLPADPLSPGYPLTDNGKWLGTTIPTPNTAGYPLTDAVKWAGGAIPTPNVTGVPKVDLLDINGTSIAGTGTQVAAAFLNYYNVAAPVATAAGVNQAADSNVILAKLNDMIEAAP